MGERLFGIDSNSDCLLLYLNDVDVTGAGGKPLRKSWYFGYLVFTELLGGTIINGNNVDGCTRNYDQQKSQIRIFLTIYRSAVRFYHTLNALLCANGRRTR